MGGRRRRHGGAAHLKRVARSAGTEREPRRWLRLSSRAPPCHAPARVAPTSSWLMRLPVTRDTCPVHTHSSELQPWPAPEGAVLRPCRASLAEDTAAMRDAVSDDGRTVVVLTFSQARPYSQPCTPHPCRCHPAAPPYATLRHHAALHTQWSPTARSTHAGRQGKAAYAGGLHS